MNLTTLEAFKAMSAFLEIYYKRTKSDDLGGLLSDMMLTDDYDITADPAAWQDWIDSIKTIKGKISILELTQEEAYKSMIKFLDRYCKEIKSKDVEDLLSDMALITNAQQTKNSEAWQNWVKSVEKVLSNKQIK